MQKRTPIPHWRDWSSLLIPLSSTIDADFYVIRFNSHLAITVGTLFDFDSVETHWIFADWAPHDDKSDNLSALFEFVHIYHLTFRFSTHTNAEPDYQVPLFSIIYSCLLCELAYQVFLPLRCGFRNCNSNFHIHVTYAVIGSYAESFQA